ncbi:cytochrome P450 [Mycena galopus ATCC 62051]|nr:cytochrome P450 [Mycena galopus ATCC 62051]
MFLLPFPPGPRRRPIVGNLYDMPTESPWKTYRDWGEQYGDVVHVEVFGKHVLILNSLKAAMDLLEKRASIYSDKPLIPMMSLMGWDFAMSFMSKSETWRQHRKLLDQHFRRAAIPLHHPVQLRKIQYFLRGLLSTPEDFVAHAKTLTAAIIMATVYGYDIKPTHDRFVDLVDESLEKLGGKNMLPSAFAVNTFPFLRYLPSWFPGCGFHRLARETFELLDEAKSAPFDWVRQNMRDGVGRSCVSRELLEDNDAQGGSKEREKMIKDVGATAYIGTSNPSIISATLCVFILAMALHPEVLRKAQNEIDTVVGLGCLPGFEHRSALPYCEAVIREVSRWRPVAPLGLPHATSESDIYEGYFIPKGRRLSRLLNIGRAMVHDESMYSHPDIFNPERFFNDDGQLNADDRILTFGFGRRTCPGRYAADAVVWATVVSVLATFNIAKAKDETGKDIDIDPAFADGLISFPKSFKCTISPRNSATRQLIENFVVDT